MKPLRITLIALAATALLAGCIPGTGPALIRGTGTIRYMSIEGGFFAIRGDDGVTYDPASLPQPFQADGLRVRFLAVPRSGVSVHMVGVMVKIVSIDALR